MKMIANSFQHYPLLNVSECESVARKVRELYRRWRWCEESVLATLGSPVYRNSNSLQDYFRAAVIDNDLLWQNFGWLYGRVFSALERILEIPLRILPGAALPGFHILDATRGYQGGGYHYDLSHRLLGMNIGDLNLSFTLAIELPDAGGGVEISNITYSDFIPPHQFERPPTANYHRYELGHLHTYPGFRLHQIAPVAPDRNGKYRITLQGHCVQYGGWVIAFW